MSHSRLLAGLPQLPYLRVSAADEDAGVVEATLARNKVNAMDADFLRQLLAFFDWADAADAVRAILLTSASKKAFSAGLDLGYAASLGDEEAAVKFIRVVDYALVRAARSPKPVACAVTGHAIAGGFVLACSCDHVVVGAAPSARFGLTEVRVGVPFPRQAIEMSRHHMQNARGVRDLVYTGRLVSAADAFERGFGDVLASSPADARSRALAWAVAATEVRADIIRLTKQQVNAPFFQQLAPTSTADEPERTGLSRSLLAQSRQSAQLMVSAIKQSKL
eukprot:NODE_2598_length_1029_cov_32.659645_g2579_i0.p1 GENE.NODE_2598_length_1029_cov_32.659645_g2579_i0~~NODE_2598_length_1029_cov_32.659645_g2579_i0.p1  ORF type:complete len:299 (-),score=76.65 NODE_2598_length_1029_cov_32.659645_g2579_i0:131-964(-)